MSVAQCPYCGKWIDEDYDVDHYEECAAETEDERED